MKKEKRKKFACIVSAFLFAAVGCTGQRTPVSVYAAGPAPLAEDLSLPKWQVCISAENAVARLLGRHAGNRITGRAKRIYDFLEEQIKKTAAGENTSTQFTIPVKELVEQMLYTQEELGVSFDSKKEQQEALGRFMEREVITNEELQVVFSSLLADLPYELYWYDKAAEGSFVVFLDGVQTRNDSERGKCLCVEDAVLSFGFLVDGYYGDEYQTNAASIDAARKAAANAQKIVDAASGQSDYQKLVYYRNKICELVSYDQQAAQTRSKGNQNPWQIVNVFDGDTTTNVVCEGYAKAFQYLCDLTAFADDDIYSYIVTGSMAGSTGEGSHMWNIVHMGVCGNYLVDVTNCDQDMIGEDNQLFLTGCAYGNMTDGYSFEVKSQRVTYRYQDKMKSIYSGEDLTLVCGPALKESDIHMHTWEKTQTVEATCTLAGKQVSVCPVCGKAKVEELPAVGHAYEVSFFWSKSKEACTVALVCKNDSSHRLAQHAKDAGLAHEAVTLHIKDADGSQKYILKLDVMDLTVGNILSVYRLDSETGKYQMVDGQTGYTVREDGSIDLSLHDNQTYQLLNAAQADAVEAEILKTVAPAGTSMVLKKGQRMKFSLSSSLDMENVKKIVYSSSRKAVAKVASNGKITAKKAGTAVVKAKVVLKNGKMKTVSMKVKVK